MLKLQTILSDSKESIEVKDVSVRVVSHPLGAVTCSKVPGGIRITATSGTPSVMPLLNGKPVRCRNGSWSFAVQIKTVGSIRVGWALVSKFRANGAGEGVGIHPYSWACDGFHSRIWSEGVSSSAFNKWEVDHTVQCLLQRTEECSDMIFRVAGQGQAHETTVEGSYIREQDVFSPCITLSAGQTVILLTQQQSIAHEEWEYQTALQAEHKEVVPDLGRFESSTVRVVPRRLSSRRPWNHAFIRAAHRAVEEAKITADNLLRRFHRAVSINDIETVATLLSDDRVDVNAVDPESTSVTVSGVDSGLRAIHWAARRGLRSMVELLLSHKAEVDPRTRLQHTPLLLAVESDELDMARFLISKGADTSAADWRGRNCMLKLFSQCHVTAPNVFYESMKKREEFLSFLVSECKMKVNIADNDGRSPLMLACRHGLAIDFAPKGPARSPRNADRNHQEASQQVNLVRSLVSYGADIHHSNKHGWDCMMELACKSKLLAYSKRYMKSKQLIMSFLESKGLHRVELIHSGDMSWRCFACGNKNTNTNAVNEDGSVQRCPECQTPDLSDMIASNFDETNFFILKTTIDAKRREYGRAIPEPRFDSYPMLTLFLFACVRNNVPAAEFLLENLGANPNATCQSHRNALVLAAGSAADDIIEWLLSKELADVNAQCPHGETALMYACRNGNETTVKMLLESNADPCLTERRRGSTALLDAVDVEHPSLVIVRTLVENGADVNYVNAFVSKKVMMRKHVEVAQYLLDHGADPNAAHSFTHEGVVHACARHGSDIYLELMKKLVEKGAHLCVSDRVMLETPLMIAVERRHASGVDVILEGLGDDEVSPALNAVNKNGYTPFLLAVRANDLSLIRSLHACDDRQLEHRVTSTLDTALHVACGSLLDSEPSESELQTKLKIVQHLKNYGLSPEAMNKFEQTPLWKAVENGFVPIAEYLSGLRGGDVSDIASRFQAAFKISANNYRWSMMSWLAEKQQEQLRRNVDAGEPLMPAVDHWRAVEKALKSMHDRKGNQWVLTVEDIARLIQQAYDAPEQYHERLRRQWVDWIHAAYDMKRYEVAACLLGSRFCTIEDRDLPGIVEDIELQDEDDLNFLCQLSRKGVFRGPSPLLACLRVVQLLQFIAKRYPTLRTELNVQRSNFCKLSNEIVGNLKGNDFVLSLLLEQKVNNAPGCTDTLIDLALHLRNVEFLRATRVDTVVNWWWVRNAPLTWDTLMAPRRLFQSPRIKFLMEMFSFFTLLVLFSVLLTLHREVDDPIHWLEWLLGAYAFAYATQEVSEMIVQGRDFFDDLWNQLDIAICVVATIVITCRAIDWGDAEPIVRVVYFTTMTAGAMIVWWRALAVLTLSKTIFPLLLTVQRMAGDLYNFSTLLLVIVGGAFFAFTFIIGESEVTSTDDAELRRFLSPRNLLFLLFQRGLVGESVDDFEALPLSEQVVSQALGSLYLLIAAVVIMNLLIAMMNDTYSRAKKESGSEFIFTRTQIRYNYDQSYHGLYPPFNILSMLVFVSVWFLAKIFIKLRDYITGSQATYCAHCHQPLSLSTEVKSTSSLHPSDAYVHMKDQSQSLLLSTDTKNPARGNSTYFSDNYFAMRNHQDKTIARQEYYLDELIDIDAVLVKAINIQWLKHERNAGLSAVELSDEQFKQRYSDEHSHLDDDVDDREGYADQVSEVRRHRKRKDVPSYIGDADVDRFVKLQSQVDFVSLNIADHLVGSGQLCPCGRLAKPISGRRYVFEWLNSWMFMLTWWPFITVSGLVIIALSKALGTEDVRRRRRDDSARGKAHRLFQELQRRFWRKLMSAFKVETARFDQHPGDDLLDCQQYEPVATQQGNTINAASTSTSSLLAKIDSLAESVAHLHLSVKALEKQANSF